MNRHHLETGRPQGVDDAQATRGVGAHNRSGVDAHELRGVDTRLAQREAQLVAEVDAARTTGRSDDAAAHGRSVRDTKDDALDREQARLRDAQMDRDIDELSLVRAARRRLADGRWGSCESCGEPIAADRLRAEPAVARCAACQTSIERAYVSLAR